MRGLGKLFPPVWAGVRRSSARWHWNQRHLGERSKLQQEGPSAPETDLDLVATPAITPSVPAQQWFQPQKKAADDIRTMVEQTTMILAEGLKASAGSTDKSAAGQLNRYYTTRAYLVMERYATAIDKYAGGLSPSELLVVGMNFSYVNRHTP